MLAGRRAIVITHDVLDALMLADRVVILENGRISEEGPPATFSSARAAGSRPDSPDSTLWPAT
ncbi:hypothetical protein AHiyo4_47120 [Arthrobacter sp. Hiyo4]|nr:hypothetical protein AHiyo4_47120 [Arthrobacter sp. Hiyo4]